MVDKVMAVRRERIGEIIGRLPDLALLGLDRSLAFAGAAASARGGGRASVRDPSYTAIWVRTS